MKNIRLVVYLSLLFAFIMNTSCSSEEFKGKTLYYRSFVGKGLPFTPVDEVSEAVAKSQKSYYIGSYNDRGQLEVLEKYLDGNLFFRHQYEYDPKGRCVLARVRDEKGVERVVELNKSN